MRSACSDKLPFKRPGIGDAALALSFGRAVGRQHLVGHAHPRRALGRRLSCERVLLQPDSLPRGRWLPGRWQLAEPGRELGRQYLVGPVLLHRPTSGGSFYAVPCATATSCTILGAAVWGWTAKPGRPRPFQPTNRGRRLIERPVLPDDNDVRAGRGYHPKLKLQSSTLHAPSFQVTGRSLERRGVVDRASPRGEMQHGRMSRRHSPSRVLCWCNDLYWRRTRRNGELERHGVGERAPSARPNLAATPRHAGRGD